MSLNEQVIRRWFEEFNKGRDQAIAVVDETLADSYVQHDPATPVEGKPAMREFMAALFDAFPDVHLALEDVVDAGDRVVYRALLSGTHRREFMGIPATGKRFESPVISVARFAGGKVADEWQVWDMFGMLRQIGVLPEAFTAEANKATVRRWMDALNGADIDVLDDLATTGYVYHGPGIEMRGIPALKAFLTELRSCFADLHFTTERLVFEGDFGAAQYRMQGRQCRDFLGIPSRGAALNLALLVISRFEGGKVAEDWELFDSAEMRRQLGAE
jgi:steroid delta-isomerase-like uncharacterized protein